MSRMLQLLFVTFFLALSSSAQDMQNPASGNPQGADDKSITIRTEVQEVNLVLTATDKRGRFVKDLRQDDFQILDDGKPPEAIRSFRAETDLPVRVGLVIDASASIRERFRFEQDAAIEFLNQTVRPKTDRGFRHRFRFCRGGDARYEITF